ncbi:MAG: hypothetical protein ABIQ70_07005 [Dokdonella sp.]
MSTAKPENAKPASIEWPRWGGDVDRAFVVRDDVSADVCYDAATMKMEQIERLLRGEREAIGTEEAPDLDPVILSAIALLMLARAAYASAFYRAARA